MLKYLLGLIKNLFNPAVSLLVKIDDKSTISHKAKVYGLTQVTSSTIGDYSYVGRHSRVIYADVGKFCSIAGSVKLGMAAHTLDKLSTSPIFTERVNSTRHQWTDVQTDNPYNRVRVGNDVWIGENVMVLGGVTIGDGAVIGAGAVVTKEVPPYAIVGGVPAKIIRYRFSEEQIGTLLNLKWWDKPDSLLKNNIKLYQMAFDDDILELCKEILGGGKSLIIRQFAACLSKRRCAA